jgi:hypothetical protein
LEHNLDIAFSGKDRNVDSAAHFIQIEFQRQNHVPSKVVYPHFTTATDTSNIQVVFQVVMDSILKDNLRVCVWQFHWTYKGHLKMTPYNISLDLYVSDISEQTKV